MSRPQGASAPGSLSPQGLVTSPGAALYLPSLTSLGLRPHPSLWATTTWWRCDDREETLDEGKCPTSGENTRLPGHSVSQFAN